MSQPIVAYESKEMPEMRCKPLLLSLTLPLILMGCSESPFVKLNTQLATPAVRLNAPVMQTERKVLAAQTTRSETRLPISFESTPCDGEPVLVTGTLVFHNKSTFAPSGNNHFVLNVRFEDVEARRVSDGREYIYLDNVNQATQILGRSGVFVDTQTSNAKLIDKGSGEDFYLHTNFHTTVVDGEVTSVVANGSSDCK